MSKIKNFIKDHKAATAIVSGITLVTGAAVSYGVMKRKPGVTWAHPVTMKKARDLAIPVMGNGGIEELWTDDGTTIQLIANTTKKDVGYFFEELYAKVSELKDCENISLIVGFDKD